MIQQERGNSASDYTGRLCHGSARCSAGFACALGLLLVVSVSAAHAQTVNPNFVGVVTSLTFSGLTGPNLAPYLGSTEGALTLAPTAGSWFQSTTYGNPAPSIFDGPINNPGSGALLLTAGSGRTFSFYSLGYSSNNGDSAYDIQGYLGANLVFEKTGTLGATYTPTAFATLFSSNPSAQVDGLLIQLIPIVSSDPLHNATSINLDNISVVIVPEPEAAWLLGVGLIVLFARRKSDCRWN